ncbi:hypothetical protein DRQ33_05165 [bacterium]|nr:MAG: hypothetical protein DRQ33_05165 [bacterium]
MRSIIILLVMLVLVAVQLFAQVPRTMNYQARLTDDTGTAITDADRVIAFFIYTVETGGSPLWAETLSVNCVNGLFDVQLGAVHPMNLPFDEPYWIQLKVDIDDDGSVAGGADEFFAPREKLAPVSYSHRAVYADTADYAPGTLPSGSSGQTLRHNGTSWIANSTIYNDGTNIGIGTNSPSARLHVVGNIKMVDGSQGAGKVLTSDGTGLATWQTPSVPNRYTSFCYESTVYRGCSCPSGYINGVNIIMSGSSYGDTTPRACCCHINGTGRDSFTYRSTVYRGCTCPSGYNLGVNLIVSGSSYGDTTPRVCACYR